jgi:hypothetical protein
MRRSCRRYWSDWRAARVACARPDVQRGRDLRVIVVMSWYRGRGALVGPAAHRVDRMGYALRRQPITRIRRTCFTDYLS